MLSDYEIAVLREIIKEKACAIGFQNSVEHLLSLTEPDRMTLAPNDFYLGYNPKVSNQVLYDILNKIEKMNCKIKEAQKVVEGL